MNLKVVSRAIFINDIREFLTYRPLRSAENDSPTLSLRTTSFYDPVNAVGTNGHPPDLYGMWRVIFLRPADLRTSQTKSSSESHDGH